MGRVEMRVETTIDPSVLRRMEERTYLAIERGVVRTVTLGESVAKRLAPVRKVSQQTGKPRTRALTKAEVRHLPARIRTNLSATQLSRLRTTTRRGRQVLPASEVEQDISGAYRLKLPSGAREASRPYRERLVTGRGRAELRESGRTQATSAIHLVGAPGGASRLAKSAPGARLTLGGRLRDEIRFVSLETRGGRIRYRLESPTPYAGYVEFPTSRTAAQPYMRPARESMKKVLRRNIVQEVERIGWRVVS